MSVISRERRMDKAALGIHHKYSPAQLICTNLFDLDLIEDLDHDSCCQNKLLVAARHEALEASKAPDSRIRSRSNFFRPTFEGLADVDIAQGSIASRTPIYGKMDAMS